MTPPPFPKTPVSGDTAGDDPRIGTVLGERYRIDALIGEGGMGRVYKAEHVLMRKKLAVKILHNELTSVPDVVTRFEREAMAAANIEHANVAAATDFGKLPDGAVFLVLEYVEGQSLRDEIAKGPIAAERALKIARQIGSALASAHAIKIVHRDLKPENVLLVVKGQERDFVKVLDFGIAKVPIGSLSLGTSERPITRAGMVFGTPEYMAPEQALGQTVDGRADLYSLGVILYEMLAGVRPFTSKSATNILAQQLAIGPPPFSERAQGIAIPPQVEQLVLCLLRRDADERPKDAAELVSRIDSLLVQPVGETSQMFTQIGGSLAGNDRGAGGQARGALAGEGILGPGLQAGSHTGQAPGSAFDVGAEAGATPAFVAPRPPGGLPADGAPGAAAAAAAGAHTYPQGSLAGPGPQALPPSSRLRPGSSSGPPSPGEEAGPGALPRSAGMVLTWVDGLRASLPGPLRRIPAPALLAVAALVLAGGFASLLAVAASLAVPVPEPAPNASAAPSATPRQPAAVQPPATDPTKKQLAAAKRKGSDPLRALAKKYPKSTKVLLELAKAYRLERKFSDAVEAIRLALSLDPKLNQNKDVARMLWQTAQPKQSVEATFALLEGPMGSRGADIVFDLVEERKVREAVKRRGAAYLKSEHFKSQASPTLQVAVALRYNRSCKARYDLLPRAKQVGDERALKYLRECVRTRGCGRRGSHDCYPCMRRDNRLKDAIEAIEKRRKKG